MRRSHLGVIMGRNTIAQIAEGAMSVSTKRSTARAGFPMEHYNLGMTGTGAAQMEKSSEHTRMKHD